MTTDPQNPRPALPKPLAVALLLVFAEATAYVVVGIAEWVVFDPDKAALSISTGLFFVAFGGFLGFCAFRLRRLSSWARAPIVMTQLIQIPVGISFWGGGWKPVSVLILAVSVAVLVGVFHPASIAAIEAGDEQDS